MSFGFADSSLSYFFILETLQNVHSFKGISIGQAFMINVFFIIVDVAMNSKRQNEQYREYVRGTRMILHKSTHALRLCGRYSENYGEHHGTIINDI